MAFRFHHGLVIAWAGFFAGTTISVSRTIVAQEQVSTEAEAADSILMPPTVAAHFAQYCARCHGEDQQEGEIRLDAISELPPNAQSELLSKLQEQLHFRKMPPSDESQPSEVEREQLMSWLAAQIKLDGGTDINDKVRYPQYGNSLDHELLFGGAIDKVAYTPARRWLVRPQIFHERVIEVFRLTGRDRDNFLTSQFYGVTNPFVLPDHSGVRDYDITALDGGHLLVMLNNAQWIASKQIFAARLEVEGSTALTEQLSKADRWYPRQTPEAFKTIILSDGPPNEERMIAAIQQQFDCVLRRQATNEEVQRYLRLLQTSIELGGNTEGLKRMLIAVLLESEFLYRLEFGAGEVDPYGRQKLAPREAAYAISYALGDRSPDATLMQAAEEDRLQTREDYEREVRRLLADPNYYRGQIDPAINGKHYQSNVTSHPRTVRFFRDFFGYPAATKVFKDGVRIGGIYSNPDRGTLGTPGWLILEADRIVTWHVERDTNVFEELLTSDKFFVYHNMDNETGQETMHQWQTVYEQLKETDWRENPQQVLEQHLTFLSEHAPSLRINQPEQSEELTRWMFYFEESLGRGRTPFTRAPWGHGYTYHHSPLYSLPGTPSIGRYHLTVRDDFKGFDDDAEFWDYPVQQPFQIENRRGILTHPAWLVAHSTNFNSDPVRRGRWIREKLLAGQVPDIPITVDAQVPDQPEHTFRERIEHVTEASSCWNCHQSMNPLGLPFESFDDFGRFRTVEDLEHPDNLISAGNTHGVLPVYRTAPVDSSGTLTGTGDPALDGDVDDAFELIDRLARSERVRQSIIRHAFRFYLGRNEMLSDSQTLIDADRAYRESGGSFNEVIVSLLSSDSFMYRKRIEE